MQRLYDIYIYIMQWFDGNIWIEEIIAMRRNIIEYEITTILSDQVKEGH